MPASCFTRETFALLMLRFHSFLPPTHTHTQPSQRHQGHTRFSVMCDVKGQTVSFARWCELCQVASRWKVQLGGTLPLTFSCTTLRMFSCLWSFLVSYSQPVISLKHVKCLCGYFNWSQLETAGKHFTGWPQGGDKLLANQKQTSFMSEHQNFLFY